MKVDIIPIGNSKGIRIPKALLEQCGFDKTIEIAVEDNHLILSPVSELREGWNAAFETMATKNDDILHDTFTNAFDDHEWQW
jgi:antitoxin MazE